MCIENWDVVIADFGLWGLKNFCKLFHNYSNMLNKWSAPEVWEKHHKCEGTISPLNDKEESKTSANPPTPFDKKYTFYDQPQVDIYSFGMIMWELETG